MIYSLLVFTTGHVGDYSAGMFEESGITISQVNDFMDENGVVVVDNTCFSDDKDVDWEVHFEGERYFSSEDEANGAQSLIEVVSDHVGNTSMKHNSCATLIIEFEEEE